MKEAPPVVEEEEIKEESDLEALYDMGGKGAEIGTWKQHRQDDEKSLEKRGETTDKERAQRCRSFCRALGRGMCTYTPRCDKLDRGHTGL